MNHMKTLNVVFELSSFLFIPHLNESFGRSNFSPDRLTTHNNHGNYENYFESSDLLHFCKATKIKAGYDTTQKYDT